MLPLTFNPDEELPSLRQRLELAEAGLLEGVAMLEKPPIYECEDEIFPHYKEPTVEEVPYPCKEYSVLRLFPSIAMKPVLSFRNEENRGRAMLIS